MYDLVYDFSKSSTGLDIERFPDLFSASGPLRQGLPGKIVSGSTGNIPDHMKVRLGSVGDGKKSQVFLRFPGATPNRKNDLIHSIFDSESR